MNPYAIEKVSKEVRDRIANVANAYSYNKDQVFYRTLEMNYGEEAGYLYSVMGNTYANCGRVDEIGGAQDFKGYNVKAACEQTGSYYENPDFGWFKSAFIASTISLKNSIQKLEVINPTGAFAGASLLDNLQKHLEKVQEGNQRFEESEDEIRKAKVNPDKAQKAFKDAKKTNAEIVKELREIDIYGVMNGDSTMQESAKKMYEILVKNGMDKNEALAVIGNSLIEMHNHPTVYIQKAAFPLAVYGGMEACAVNPACVRLVHTVIATAAGDVAAFGIKETFEKAPDIERKFSTPIHEYKSENEGFSIWNHLPTWLGGFDAHEYKSADEGFIPEDVDTSILMKDWEVKEFDKVMLSDKFGKMYRDPKATSENGKRIWWSKDTAGHGGSAWKVFEETDKGLTWYKDADKNGNFIVGKHKGDVGMEIKWKNLRGVTVNGK